MAIDIAPPPEQDSRYRVSWTELLTRTIDTWSRKPLAFIAMMVPVAVTYIACAAIALLLNLSSEVQSISRSPYEVFMYLLSSVLTYPAAIPIALMNILSMSVFVISLAAVTHYSLRTYENQVDSTSVNESFGIGVSTFSRVLCIVIVTDIIASAVMLPGPILTIYYLILVFDGGYEYVHMILIGLVLTLVGLAFSVYITIRLRPAIPVAVEERRTVLDSLRQSWTLTRGQFWHSFGGYLLLVILVSVVTLLFSSIFYLSWGLVLVTVATTLLVSPLEIIFWPVLYRDLVARQADRAATMW